MTDYAPTSFRHVYHLNRWRLLPMPVAFGSLALMFLLFAIGAQGHEREDMLLLAGIVSLIALPLVFILWQSRLVLTHEGIAHHQFGYTVRSTWANLEALTLQSRGEGLYLKEPGTKNALLRASAKAMDTAMRGASSVIGDPNALAQGKWIYLAPFMSHWKRGPLKEDIQRMAPHLFDGNGRAR